MSIGSLRFHRIHFRRSSARGFQAWLRKALRRSFVEDYRTKLVVSALLILSAATYSLSENHTFVNVLALLLTIAFIYVLLGMFYLPLEIISAPVRAIVKPTPLGTLAAL